MLYRCNETAIRGGEEVFGNLPIDRQLPKSETRSRPTTRQLPHFSTSQHIHIDHKPYLGAPLCTTSPATMYA
jgi:hypothetical protein